MVFVRSHRAVIVSALLMLASAIALVLYAYPGCMSFDSVWQLRDARAGHYGDWHPPIMALLWRLVDTVVKGPLGMLVLQGGLVLGGAYLILRPHVSERTAAWGAAFTLLFPPDFTAFAVIWKDCQMAAYLLMAIGLLLVPRRWAQLAALPLFLIGSAMRYNAFTISAAPIILLFHPVASLRGVRRYALSTLVWIAVTGAAMAVNTTLTSERQYPWHGSVAMFDIVGTLRFAPTMDDATVKDYLKGTPVQVASDLQETVRKVYSPVDGVFAIMNKGFMRQPTNEDERQAVKTAWIRLVTDHPFAYLWHRSRAFRELLGLTPRTPDGVWVGIDATGADLVPYTRGPIQSRAQHLALKLARTWIMRPYLYLLVVLGLSALAVAWRHRTAIALGASGLMSEGALFFLSPTPDFRYSLWIVITSILMAFLLFVWRYRMAGGLHSRPQPADHAARRDGPSDRPHGP